MLSLVAYALVCALILGQTAVTVRLWRSDLYVGGQKVAQCGMIWLLPLVGAIVVYAALRHEEDVPAPRANREGGEHESLWGEGD